MKTTLQDILKRLSDKVAACHTVARFNDPVTAEDWAEMYSLVTEARSALESPQRLQARLTQFDNPLQTVDCLISVQANGIEIGFDGYSTFDDGEPVFIELYRNRPRVIVWTDYAEQNPTHFIDLEQAKRPPQ